MALCNFSCFLFCFVVNVILWTRSSTVTYIFMLLKKCVNNILTDSKTKQLTIYRFVCSFRNEDRNDMEHDKNSKEKWCDRISLCVFAMFSVILHLQWDLFLFLFITFPTNSFHRHNILFGLFFFFLLNKESSIHVVLSSTNKNNALIIVHLILV